MGYAATGQTQYVAYTLAHCVRVLCPQLALCTSECMRCRLSHMQACPEP